MSQDLVNPTDFADASERDLDAAVAAVRAAAGWHIAPTRTETVALDVVRQESRLRLPTRQLVEVDAIRAAADGSVFDPSTYSVSRALAQVRRTDGYWPSGYEAVEVDMTHGYATCPADVAAAVRTALTLAKRDPTVRQVSIDDFSTSYRTDATTNALRSVLGGYALADSVYGMGLA